MKYIKLIILLLIVNNLFAQSYTISGYIKDGETGEALIGAHIYSTFNKGVTSNTYGFFSITLPQTDSLGIVFSFIGYAPQAKQISLMQNIRLNIELVPNVGSLDEVVIRSTRDEDNIQAPQMGVIDIPLKKLKQLPVVLGETDVLKVIQLLPGVQSGNEGTTGFYVRGGNVDQNLVQLDEATVYNPNHLFGFFSTFNSRALNNVTLIKGGFPAQYGGRLSSILDISMKEGNNKEFRGEGGIGLISSQLTLEGPIKPDKASFIVSARRTYLDLILKGIRPSGNQSDYHFYDLNGKVNWQLSEKDRIFFSVFKGNDNAGYKETQGTRYDINFGNTTATLRWNHLFAPKLFLNTSVIYNKYKQNISSFQNEAFSQTFSGIEDASGKVEFQYFPSPSHSIRFGAHYTYHKFSATGKSQSQATTNPELDRNNVPAKYFDEYAFYFNDEITISKKIALNVGVRAPGFISKKVSYNKIEPRATAKISLGKRSSLKFAYTVMNQFVHLIPSSTASVPTDIWVPSTERTKPQFSEQFAIGIFKNFNDNQIEASIELYSKTMDNQVLFREGNRLIESLDVDNDLVYGKGTSYGAEFFLKKNTGRLTGWVSYTLSKTDQQFPDLNFGKEFPFRYDRRHVLAIVGTYELNKKWTLSAVFNYSTGAVYTLPEGRFRSVNGGTLFEGHYFVYNERNNVRLNSYHRLDFSATYKKRRTIFGKEYDSEWVFGLYNVYSRNNPYFVYLQVDPVTQQPKATQVSLLPIIPSVSYNFKF